MNIIVLRESESPSDDRKKLSPAKVHFLPAIKTKALPIRVPTGHYDFILISSAKTLRYLKKIPQSDQVLCIGNATAEKFKQKFKHPCWALKNSSSQGILEFFKNKKSQKIFYPRSALGDPSVVKKLRDLGHSVCVRHPYTTRLRPIRGGFKSLLRRLHQPAVLVSSPSIVKALRQSFKVSELRQMPVQWISIGPTSSKELTKLVGKNFLEAPETSLKGVLKALKAWHRSCFSSS